MNIFFGNFQQLKIINVASIKNYLLGELLLFFKRRFNEVNVYNIKGMLFNRGK